MRMMQVLSQLAATVMDKILTTPINLNYGEYGLLYALRRIQDFVQHTSSITSSDIEVLHLDRDSGRQVGH